MHSREELAKCNDLVRAAEGYEAHSGLGLGCHFSITTSDCYSSIYYQMADVVTLDGGDVHEVTRYVHHACYVCVFSFLKYTIGQKLYLYFIILLYCIQVINKVMIL